MISFFRGVLKDNVYPVLTSIDTRKIRNRLGGDNPVPKVARQVSSIGIPIP